MLTLTSAALRRPLASSHSSPTETAVVDDYCRLAEEDGRASCVRWPSVVGRDVLEEREDDHLTEDCMRAKSAQCAVFVDGRAAVQFDWMPLTMDAAAAGGEGDVGVVVG